MTRSLKYTSSHMRRLCLVLSIFLGIFLFGCVLQAREYTWQHYGKWYEVETSSALNEAMRAARADNRPLVVLLSSTGCLQCLSLMRNVYCDGTDKYCQGRVDCSVYSTHPMVDYGIEKKLVTVYLKSTSPLATGMMGFTYKDFFEASGSPRGVYPVMFIFHVKDDATCDKTSNVLLDSSEVDCLAAFMYNYDKTINGVHVPLGTPEFDVWRQVFQSFLLPSNPYNTFWESVEPEPEAPKEYESAETLSFSDSSVGEKAQETIAADVATKWYKFDVVSGKRYWFKLSEGSPELAPSFFMANGNGVPSLPVACGTSSDGSFYMDATSAGTAYIEFARETTTALEFGFRYRLGSSSAGSSMSAAVADAVLGMWTTSYSAVPTSTPIVLAVVKDKWSEDALELDAYVQTSAFEDAFSRNYLVVVDSAPSGIESDCDVELFYLRKKGDVVGRLTNQSLSDDIPAGKVVVVPNFEGSNGSLFPQFVSVADDEYEERNNLMPGAVALEDGLDVTGLVIGGVDSVDWYSFTTNNTSEVWKATFVGDGANLSVSFHDSEGNELQAAVASGTMTSTSKFEATYKPSAANQKVYMKVVSAGTSEPKEYGMNLSRSQVNYKVGVSPSVQRTIYVSNAVLDIDVTLTEVQAGDGYVYVKLSLDSDNSSLKGASFVNGTGKTITVYWTPDEKTSAPTKTVQVKLPSSVSDLGAHSDVIVTCTVNEDDTDPSSATVVEQGTATIEVYSEPTSPLVLAGNEMVMDFKSDGSVAAQTLEIATPATTSLFWELLNGEKPDGMTLKLDKSTDDGTRWTLAVGAGNGTVAGEYSFTIKLYSLGDGTQIFGGSTVTIRGEVLAADAVKTSLARGWNIVAVPWNVKSLSKAEVEAFLGKNTVMTVSDGVYVEVSTMEGGQAYWVYAKTSEEAIQLAGSVDSGKSPEPVSGDDVFWFGTDPGAAWREYGWCWNPATRKFELAKPDAAGTQGGWWYLKK